MQLDYYTKGSTPSPIESESANKVVKAVNSILNGEVIPKGSGKVIASEGNFVIQLDLDTISSFSGYPWVGYTDDGNRNYFAWFGVGNSSFTTGGAKPLKGLQINVSGSDSGSEMALTVGDSAGNDAFTLYNGSNYVKIQWLSESMITLSHAADSASAVFQTESLVFTDADNTHASGLHAAYLDFDNSKGFFGYDESDDEYKLTLSDGSTSCGLHVDHLELDGSNVFLGRSDDEDTTHLEISDESAYINLNGSIWLGYGTDSTWHLEISDASAYVELGTGSDCFFGKGSDGVWQIAIKDTSGYVSIGGGSVWLGYGGKGGKGHLELPEDGYVDVGDTSISSGDIDLGATGTVTIAKQSYSPQGISIAGLTLEVLATSDCNLGDLINGLINSGMEAINAVIAAGENAVNTAVSAASGFASSAASSVTAANSAMEAAYQACDAAGIDSDAAQAAQKAAEAAQSAATASQTAAAASAAAAAASATGASGAALAASGSAAAAATSAGGALASATSAAASLAAARALTWNGVCNSDGTFTITAN